MLCLLPDHLEMYSTHAIGSLRDSGLRNLGTDPFWYRRREPMEDCVTRFGKVVTSIARDSGLGSHIWIQGFNVPSGREAEITQAVAMSAQLLTDVIAIWGFEGCRAMSSLACDRPDVAWQSFLEGIKTATAFRSTGR